MITYCSSCNVVWFEWNTKLGVAFIQIMLELVWTTRFHQHSFCQVTHVKILGQNNNKINYLDIFSTNVNLPNFVLILGIVLIGSDSSMIGDPVYSESQTLKSSLMLENITMHANLNVGVIEIENVLVVIKPDFHQSLVIDELLLIPALSVTTLFRCFQMSNKRTRYMSNCSIEKIRL